MGELTDEMKQAFAKSGLFPFATSSSSGVPNVVPIKYVFVESNEELWLVDNYMVKSLQNIQQNPLAALYVNVSEDKICFRLKGKLKFRVLGKNINE